MNDLVIKARGKINLTLDILNKRPDGYHSVEMILQSIELSDTVTLVEGGDGVRLLSDSPDIPLDDRNIAVRAARLIRDSYGVDKGIAIHLQKNIPVAAGLAGGSADAAAVLLGLDRLWQLNLPPGVLADLGLKLGADIPFCLKGGTMLARGIGEELTPLDAWGNIPLILIKPPFGMSTKEAYEGLQSLDNLRRPDTAAAAEAWARGDYGQLNRSMGNVLEQVTIARYPQLETYKKLLMSSGAAATMMSGSGPTVYGIYHGQKQAAEAYRQIREWVTGDIFLTRTSEQGIEIR